MAKIPPSVDVAQLIAGVTAGDRASIGRAITLVESDAATHRQAAEQLLAELTVLGVDAQRIGVTGVPGVGKSTFIEFFGKQLTGRGHKVAVLAIDPSSAISGGSILGDKTRMVELSRDASAFIRPSPSAGSLGGVARKTREAIVVVEAAGYDVVLVETVGVGQSETMVAEMVDFFLLLMLAGAGDSLQGIKRGVLELADLVAINKADGDNLERASRARVELESALRYLPPVVEGWKVPVLTCSALAEQGFDELWQCIEQHRVHTVTSGQRAVRRSSQQINWMWRTVEQALTERFRHDPRVATQLSLLEQTVRDGELPATVAARRLLAAFLGD